MNLFNERSCTVPPKSLIYSSRTYFCWQEQRTCMRLSSSSTSRFAHSHTSARLLPASSPARSRHKTMCMLATLVSPCESCSSGWIACITQASHHQALFHSDDIFAKYLKRKRLLLALCQR